MRVFLDANILFSASFPKSCLADFLRGLRRHADLLTNAYAMAEAERNIAAKLPKHLATFQKFSKSIEVVPVKIFDVEVKLSEKDRPILCGAISGNAEFLLTGDKRDFGHLFGKSVRGVKVLTVQLLLAELVKRGVVSE